MTARSEDRDEDLPAKLRIPLLLILVGFVVVYGFVQSGLLAMNTFWGPRGWQASGAFAVNLLIVGAVWGLSKLRPSIARTAALLVLLAFAAVLAFGANAEILTQLRARDFLGLWYWKTLGLVAANLLVFAGAIWGIWRLRPLNAFKRSTEPVSPATRRTKLLFGLSGAVSILAVVALTLGTDGGGKSALWSNSRDVSPVFALVAIVIWLLSIALAWWWYHSADEHERRANDVGFLAGGGLFMAVTPVWWIGARAGLLPPPDAMILWYATVVVMGVGWGWYRSR